MAPTSTITRNGIASSLLTFGDKPGLYTITASCPACSSANTATFTEAASCQLPKPWSSAFSWKQSTLAPWGNEQYDTSYTTGRTDPNVDNSTLKVLAPDANLSSYGLTNRTLLLKANGQSYNIGLPLSGNTLEGIADALDNSPAPVYAEVRPVKGGYVLDVYNIFCRRQLCYPSSAFDVELSGTPPDSTNNLLNRRLIRNVGCFLTCLAMSLNYAGATTFKPPLDVTAPSGLDPRSLNSFMSNTLYGQALPNQYSFQNNADVWPENTVASIAPNITKVNQVKYDARNSGIDFRTDPNGAGSAVDAALCAANPSPFIVNVKPNSKGVLSHFVLVIEKLVDVDGTSQYLIADPGDDVPPGSTSLESKYSVSVS
jgi:hypothetical protein